MEAAWREMDPEVSSGHLMAAQDQLLTPLPPPWKVPSPGPTGRASYPLGCAHGDPAPPFPAVALVGKLTKLCYFLVALGFELRVLQLQHSQLLFLL
jgi:hypothetical protein